MATANPPVRYQEDDNYEIELSRVREKIRTQFGVLTDRLKCRERELLDELDTVLASYRSYRDEFKIVRDKVRDLEMMKQRNEEGLAASQFKMLQENIIRQIEEEIKTIIYPKQPQLVTFVCESNIIFSEIDKLGKLVNKVTDESYETYDDYDNDYSSLPITQSSLPLSSMHDTLLDEVTVSPMSIHSSQIVQTGLNFHENIGQIPEAEFMYMSEPEELSLGATAQVLTPAVLHPLPVSSTQGIRPSNFFPPPRPKEGGYGTRGRVIPLRLNFFPIEIPNIKLHMYHIDVFNDTLKS